AAKGAKTASTTSARLPQLSHGDWSKVAQRVAGQSIISSSLNTAINGGSFKDNLATALLTSVGSQLHAEGAHLIGDNGAVLGVSGKALSHALVAGVAAEIGGGNAKGAAAGALAAELAGVVMGDNIVGSQQWQEKQAQFSRVAGAIAGVLATGKVEGAYSGANAGEVVDRFNRQLHLDEIKAVNELAKGSNVKQERFLAASCRQVNCTAQEALNSAERARAELLMAKYPETPEEDGILRNYWIQKEKKRFGNYPALTGFEQIQLFTYADADKLSDSQKFAKNQWVEEASNLTGWSREAVEALGISASLAGVVRGKRFGQTGAAYPTGISFNINQKNHLANFDGFSQRKGIHGTHNADAFNQAVSSNGVKIISRTSGSVNGITHIKYQIPAKDRAGNTVGYKAEILEKTIYDPKVFSDQKMLMLGQQAAANGYQSARNSGVREYKAISDGVKFQIYLDQQTGSVINFFPVIK
ncbi:contact-dependent inhibition toxin CdiA, partial [Yersinia enterocolitica]